MAADFPVDLAGNCFFPTTKPDGSLPLPDGSLYGLKLHFDQCFQASLRSDGLFSP